MTSTFSKGFTLVEMLVVIATVSVLAALLAPALTATKRKAQRTACTNNLRQINLGVRMYSDDSKDAPPSPGTGATNAEVTLYFSYKSLMKNYVGLHGASSPRDKLFFCPADSFYPTWVLPDATPPFHFVQKSFHDEAFYDFSSYSFNGGDNELHQLRPQGRRFNYPGLTGAKLSSVKHPSRTALVLEAAAIAPWSWHEPSSHGVAREDGTYYNNSKNVMSFVDGHVSYIKVYWNPGHGVASFYDPPSQYDYQWSPD